MNVAMSELGVHGSVRRCATSSSGTSRRGGGSYDGSTHSQCWQTPATTRYDPHSSHRELVRPLRIRAAVKVPSRCSTIFSAISASIRTAFLACVSQFTYSHVLTDMAFRYE